MTLHSCRFLCMLFRLLRNQGMEKAVIFTSVLVNCLVLTIVIYLSVTSPRSQHNTNPRCDITYTDKDVIVDCVGRGFLKVPSSLPRNSTSIDLSNNYLSDVTVNSFGCMEQLHFLNLGANGIRYLQRGSLDCLPALSKLLLHDNYLNFSYEALPAGLFSNMKHLKELYLGGNNNNSNWSYPEETFKDLTNIEKLELPTPTVLEFGPVFATMVHLKLLRLHGGQSPCVRKDSFKVFSNLTLETLEFIYINSETIDRLSLGAFANVYTLVIEGMRAGLHSVLMTLGVFSGRNMSLINVQANSYAPRDRHINSKYTFLTPNDTRFLLTICVEKVDLRWNRIVFIQNGTFNMEPFSRCIKHLDLSSNCINFDKDLYMQLQTLHNIEVFSMDVKTCPKTVYLDSNSTSLANYTDTPVNNDDIWNRPDGDFNLNCDGRALHIHLPKKLKTLNLYGLMPDFNVYKCDIEVHGAENLMHLDVSYWYFYSEDTKLSGLENLRSLRYADNFGRLSPDFMFNSSYNLNTLILNSVRFDEIIEGLKTNFSDLTRLFKKLNVLSLASTGIHEFPLQPENLANISFIDLSENAISTFDPDTCQGLDKRVKKTNLTLDLSGNIMSCGCGSLRFVEWMMNTHVTFTNWQIYLCMMDDGKVVKVSDFTASFLKQWRRCFSKFWLAFAVSITFLLFATMAISILVDRNSLRLKCFLLQWWGLEFQVPKREEFKYDIFVYYSSKDDYRWVCNTFREKMEEERGLRLCIPDRDFIPGSCTAEEILEAIHNSWKTVVYMTEVFLEDELCSFTLSSAVYACTNDMPSRLILLYSNEIFNQPLPQIVTQLLDGDNNFMLEELEERGQWDILSKKALCWI